MQTVKITPTVATGKIRVTKTQGEIGSNVFKRRMDTKIKLTKKKEGD